ncbi:MAG: alpha/beta fold hydrolase [Pseudomonadota bacterium]
MTTKREELGEQAAETPTALNPVVGVRAGELIKSLGVVVGHTAKQPAPFAKHLTRYGKDLVSILKGEADYAPDQKDRRFKDPTWEKNPAYKYSMQSWFAMRKGLEGWINDSGVSEADKARAHFVMNIIADSLAPTNSLIGNPAAVKRMYETGGGSLIRGLKNAYHDLRHNGGMPSQVDGRPFKVGENLANTPGAVVFRNEMMELIQYTPTTDEVHKIPLLIVPPQINKFYANDLAWDKSIVQFLLRNGIQVFAVSWRNPQKEHAHWGLEDYVTSLIAGSEAVTKITRSNKINVSGACSGGITTASYLNELTARGSKMINCFTLQVCVLHPEKEDNEVGLFVSDEAIEVARRYSRRKGILSGENLSRSFAWLRPNDLIWNYVINNYLMGDDPPPFDILYWNSDSTNLPAQLHSDYLDVMLDQRFSNPGTVEFMDHKIDLSKIKQDSFMVAAITDHITPWKACYRNNHLFGGKTKFVLSNSGHIQALLNPPHNPKAKYFDNDEIPEDPDDWLAGAEQKTGSWWPIWLEWLQERAGEKKAAPKSLGNKAHPPLVKAPGEYVFG